MEKLKNRNDRKNAFASDNYAPICPEAMTAIEQVNSGFANAYGNDPWTERACDLLREFFATDCQVFFVFNGTAANSLALATLCQSYHSIICHELAHIETDECGAPEFFSNGTKILLTTGNSGKVDPAQVEHLVTRRSDIHYPKPKVLSLTQSTELGTVYRPEELKALKQTADRHGLRLHMDGARFANALASLDVHPAEISWKAGVDVLTFGGTKAGMAIGEAVVFFDLHLAEEFAYRCKQAGQLASKMRYLAAPWINLLKDDTLIRYARHANTLAKTLADSLRQLPGIDIVHPVEANAVFVRMPEKLIEQLQQRGWTFYTFIGTGEARLMTSWATTEEDVEALAEEIRRLLG